MEGHESDGGGSVVMVEHDVSSDPEMTEDEMDQQEVGQLEASAGTAQKPATPEACSGALGATESTHMAVCPNTTVLSQDDDGSGPWLIGAHGTTTGIQSDAVQEGGVCMDQDQDQADHTPVLGSASPTSCLPAVGTRAPKIPQAALELTAPKPVEDSSQSGSGQARTEKPLAEAAEAGSQADAEAEAEAAVHKACAAVCCALSVLRLFLWLKLKRAGRHVGAALCHAYHAVTVTITTMMCRAHTAARAGVRLVCTATNAAGTGLTAACHTACCCAVTAGCGALSSVLWLSAASCTTFWMAMRVVARAPTATAKWIIRQWGHILLGLLVASVVALSVKQWHMEEMHVMRSTQLVSDVEMIHRVMHDHSEAIQRLSGVPAALSHLQQQAEAHQQLLAHMRQEAAGVKEVLRASVSQLEQQLLAQQQEGKSMQRDAARTRQELHQVRQSVRETQAVITDMQEVLRGLGRDLDDQQQDDAAQSVLLDQVGKAVKQMMKELKDHKSSSWLKDAFTFASGAFFGHQGGHGRRKGT